MKGCRVRAGRTVRKRKRKREQSVHSVSLSHQPQYISLMRFLHRRGFSSTLLQPALFSDTGRGLQTLQTIMPGELVVSLPESCLLTTSTVLSSYLGEYIKSWKPRLSPLSALCVFLVCERQRGEASDWFPYINVLPSSYACPACFSDEVIDVLPAGVRRRGLEQRGAVREMHSSNQEFFRTLQPVLSRPTEDVLTYEALRYTNTLMITKPGSVCYFSCCDSFRWAWCSVNTRSVFMSRPSSCFLSGPDTYALAPFLDLLNHRPDVQVKAGFNEQTKCYEISSVCGTPRYEQVFINYGSHDNQRLLLEYGFVAMNNPHSVVYVEPDLLCDILRGEKSLDQKMKFLRENHFLENLTVSSEGPSWRLMVALRLLSLPQTLYHLWRSALLGQVVDEKTEVRSSQTARTLCQQLLKDTHIALDKISQLLGQCGGPVREQLEVVRELRQEERRILESCVTALKDSVTLEKETSSCKANVGAMS
ncbi:SET domain-containing protein 4 isoform X1 [Xiphophorus maculatus]|uniref:SET domain-containing protein 4 isoform X1 n=1 Tax=Xiphophorus maculatus TaxID=8083 RepID=UPI000C6EB9D9|nr:SET domain-containing protein 4 isoform X1 [Xiphophorus maculatus]XP_023183239.1 SET domain-containing protein 4 isoform X1 [Xiphophorus maculatus]